MNHPHPIQVVYCTDSGFVEPSLVSLYSLLKNTQAPVRAHIIGYRLSAEDWRYAERLCALFPHAELVKHNFDDTLIEGIGSTNKRIHPITFARLFLPRYISGRVLYIDGDTYVHGDVAPLFSMDMEGRPIAGVQDADASKFLTARNGGGLFTNRRRVRKRERVIRLMLERTGLKRVENYVNAGVLLFDVDAIKNQPDLLARMEDVRAAAQLKMMDQDWLNIVFEDRIKPLSWKWNAWRGLRITDPSHYAPHVQEAHRQAGDLPVIIHYPAFRKPWQPLRIHLFRSGFRWYLKYWFLQRAFRRDLAKG